MTESLLQLTDLRVSARDRATGALQELVHGVSLDVGTGEGVGLVGESGSGKSLTLRAMLGLLPRGCEVTGGVISRRHPGTRVRMIFQEPLTALNPTRRVADLIADAAGAVGVPRRTRGGRVLELLEEVGMPEPVRRSRMWPHELSGGQRQRVMIAMALAADPEVLLCDEPTTALDVTIQAQILDLLTRLRKTRGLALVFVSHDLAVVSEVCDRVHVMTDGQVVEEGTTAEVFSSPRDDYTRRLVRASRVMAGQLAASTAEAAQTGEVTGP